MKLGISWFRTSSDCTQNTNSSEGPHFMFSLGVISFQTCAVFNCRISLILCQITGSNYINQTVYVYAGLVTDLYVLTSLRNHAEVLFKLQYTHKILTLISNLWFDCMIDCLFHQIYSLSCYMTGLLRRAGNTKNKDILITEKVII